MNPTVPSSANATALGPPDDGPALPAAGAPLPDAAAAWAVLDTVLDPEVPVLSVVELGIVREVTVAGDGAVSVMLTPTYSGCPATEVIADSVRAALRAAGATAVHIDTRWTPAWTTDWIGATAREKLRAYGIAPPGPRDATGDAGDSAARPMFFQPRGVACPRCASAQVERLSAFGATACKALYRCLACREPFEHFKPI